MLKIMNTLHIEYAVYVTPKIFSINGTKFSYEVRLKCVHKVYFYYETGCNVNFITTVKYNIARSLMGPYYIETYHTYNYISYIYYEVKCINNKFRIFSRLLIKFILKTKYFKSHKEHNYTILSLI